MLWSLLKKSSMKKNKFLKILAVVLTILYPFIIFTALHQGYSLHLMTGVLATAILLNFLKHKQVFLLITGIILIAALAYFKNPLFLKLYPVLMNTGITLIFALSLCKKPLLTIFAEQMGHKPTPDMKAYTRKATLAWTIFMAILTSISLTTVFMSDRTWALFNGCIAYILIALMFGAEYCYRRIKCQKQ